MVQKAHPTSEENADGGAPAPSQLILVFFGHTRQLARGADKHGRILYPCRHRASIKDIIEALGVPHTEVGKIVCRRKELSFSHIPEGDEELLIYSFDKTTPIQTATVLRPAPLARITFLADNTIGKLVRNLRLAGADTEATSHQRIGDIASQAVDSGRIMLSRNRDLLKISRLVFGQLIRSSNHCQQMREVTARFSIISELEPFSRCLECNQRLATVKKSDVIDLLEPLTQRYYQAFKRCPGCSRIYWQGSHHNKLQNLLENCL